MNVTQVQIGQSVVLTLTAYSDGTATDQGPFTIGIVDANGDTVVSSGTAVSDGSDGTYTYTLAAQSDPAFLTVTWTETGGSGPDYTTYVEVVGNVLFNEYELRNFDDQQLSASNLNPSDSSILLVRQRVTEYLEQQTGRSWIPRYNRVVLNGSGNYDLYLDDGYPRTSGGFTLHRPGSLRDISEILAANDGSAVTVSNITHYPEGHLVRSDATWTKPTSTTPLNTTVEYVYGLPVPVDGVDRVAMMIAAHQLKASRIPDNASSFSDPLGTYQFDSTRLPFEAWKWIQAHREYAPFA